MSGPGTSVRIDDCSLWVAERGPEDGFPLIVLHGGPGLDHHEFGDYLDPVCDDGVRLLLVDQRAQGRSEPTPPGTWTLERMAQDVIMLALALKLRRYAVLGHSYGAFVALQNAVDYPGQAVATVVSGGVASVRDLEAVAGALESFEPAELREQVASSWERESSVTTSEEVERLLFDQLPFHSGTRTIRGSRSTSADRPAPSTRPRSSATSRPPRTGGSISRTGSPKSPNRCWCWRDVTTASVRPKHRSGWLACFPEPSSTCSRRAHI